MSAAPCPSPASPLAAPPRPPWASPPTTPTPSAVSSKTGGRSKGGIGGGYRARGIRPPLGFQPAAAAASFSCKLKQLLRSSFSSLKPSPLRQGEGKSKLKRARLAVFRSLLQEQKAEILAHYAFSSRVMWQGNLRHAFGLLLVHRRLTYPTIRLVFLKFIKPKSVKMLPFRKVVLCCY